MNVSTTTRYAEASEALEASEASVELEAVMRSVGYEASEAAEFSELRKVSNLIPALFRDHLCLKFVQPKV